MHILKLEVLNWCGKN